MNEVFAMCKRLLLLVLLVCSPMLLGAPSMTVMPQSVTVNDVTRGGTTAWFAVATDTHGYVTRVVRHAELVTDSDGDGTVRVDLPNIMPDASVWFSVDLETGVFVAGSPAAFEMDEATLPANALSHRTNAAKARLQVDGEDEELFYVRPRVGAWRVSGGDGSSGDADGHADGVATFSFDYFKPVGTSPSAPDDFEPGDVIVVVDPQRMLVRTLTVR